MKPHLPLIILTCLSLQLSAQVKNTYSFAQGDTTQVSISWDAWAVSGDPILGCNIYRIENMAVPLNEALLTSADSTYQFVDDTEFDPYYPPKYTIMAIRSSDTLEVAYAHGFSSIEFYTLGTDSLVMEFVVWNTDTCCLGVFVYLDDVVAGLTDYHDPFIITFPPGIPLYGGYGSIKLRFFSEYTMSYADLNITEDFIAYFITTVGIPEIVEPAHQLNIYPNPAKDHITFALENTEHHSNIELRCFNLLGMQQHQTTILRGQQQTSANVSAWPPGMYVVVVYSDSRPVGKGKFVVH
jgi:hypothetical protein